MNWFVIFRSSVEIPSSFRENIGMAEYAVEYGYFRKDRDLLWSRRINPSSLTWEQFLTKTGWDGKKRAFGPSQ
jgi:hypothetical protein